MRLVALGLLLAGLTSPLVAEDSKPLARGADVGWLSQMEAEGTPFYDANGKAADCLKILQGEGINSVRLRVWVNPADGWCNKDDVVKMAKRATAMGFRLMIDFHYSDTWADPQKQPKPAAWQDHDIVQLQKDVYDHTFDMLTALKQAGVTPEWVQVGNEITNGMLWPDGKTPHMADLVALINQGYNAVKTVYPDTEVIIHLNNGADNRMFRWWFDSALKLGVHFDVIGLSFYPERKDWESASDHCIANMKNLAETYGKPVMICEIGFFDTDPEITTKLLTKMIQGCEAVPGDKGLGLFYWEPEGYTKKYNSDAWQPNGKPSPALDAFRTP